MKVKLNDGYYHDPRDYTDSEVEENIADITDTKKTIIKSK